MTYNAIRRQKKKKYGMTAESCMRMFHVSKSGYYAWLKRREGEPERRKEQLEELAGLMEKFRAIVKKLGFVPGKRTFRAWLFREYDLCASVKRCAKIMRMMNLTANLPKKDAYKGQAKHDHVCASPDNKVNQNFYIGPRTVVLTDITYLYYGKNRELVYLCAFKDAYTREILGWAVSRKMDTGLVKAAYDRMMAAHGSQLKGIDKCFVHSDQGSQYLSATFQELLSDDGLTQSVSRRGNSQDNAPMESFFGRMKCGILDLIALCPDYDKAAKLVEGYIHDYNTKHYEYDLAGLTPAEYYTYVTTGVYPCDSYYGVGADEMMTVGDLVKARLDKAKEKAKKVRDKNQKDREEAEQYTMNPRLRISRDQNILRKEKSKWEKLKEQAENQVKHIDELLEKTKEAIKFLVSASKEILEELKNPQNWRKYKELDYVFEMRELF